MWMRSDTTVVGQSKQEGVAEVCAQSTSILGILRILAKQLTCGLYLTLGNK